MMTSEKPYFRWLCDRLSSTLYETYPYVLRAMYQTWFTVKVKFDQNRAEDGLYYRALYFDERGKHIPDNIQDMTPNVLEVLVAFAERASAITEDMTANPVTGIDWFEIFLDNLGLKDINWSSPTKAACERAHDAIEAFVERRYHTDGEGGLFPLKFPEKDQRKVELWDQLASYIDENFKY